MAKHFLEIKLNDFLKIVLIISLKFRRNKDLPLQTGKMENLIKGKNPDKNTIVNSAKNIFIKGARVHNLKNIDVSVPRNKLVVVTGVSGSGKSSLTIDTLFAEGQRRYAESLSAYARQFLTRMNRPDVDYIKGLCPAIAIEQKIISRTPRSTVGSMTEIYDYLRLLFARIGKTISPVSGKIVKKDDVQDVLNIISGLQEGDKVFILIALKRNKNRDLKEELNILLQKGFSRIYKNGEAIRIEDVQEQKSYSLVDEHTLVLVDRVVVKRFDENEQHRLADSIGTAFYEGDGDVFIEINGKRKFILITGLKWMECALKNRCRICFHLTILMVLVLPVKDFLRYWGLIVIW